MRQTTYRDYRIRYDMNNGWFALVYEPGAPFPIDEIPNASEKEGEALLLRRAQVMIDERIRNDAVVDSFGLAECFPLPYEPVP